MKRWCINLFITAYLLMLSFGITAHALNFGVQSHPGMYFIVWDMFCGWSAYSHRYHIIGESQSGNYYELAPGPWGQFQPYGELARHHYDTTLVSAYGLAMNALKHTRHEPVHRIYVIEETWAKKFNLPEYLWWRVNDVPKDPQSYYALRRVIDTNGIVQANLPSWHDRQALAQMQDNPRLVADVKRSKPFYAVNVAAKTKPANDFVTDSQSYDIPELQYLGN